MSRWQVSPRVRATYCAHVRVVASSVSASIAVSGCAITVEPDARSADAARRGPAIVPGRSSSDAVVADQPRRSALYASESSVVERHVGEQRVAVEGVAIGERELGALLHRVDEIRPAGSIAARSKPRSSASCCNSTGLCAHGPGLQTV